MPYISSFERAGIEKGLEQGLQQGLQQGRLVGKAQLLRRQLARRFGEVPDWALKKIETAAESALEAWCDAVFEARSIGDVFANPAH